MHNNCKVTDSGCFSPVIIIGMHRSGTTMITQMLESLGLFVGVDLDSNHEPKFMIELNDWILRQSGGTWDYPSPMKKYFSPDGEGLLNLSTDYLTTVMSGINSRKLIGIKKVILGERPFNMSTPWGWKDPRNTFTLPIWLRLFPEAKVIHVYRHGVDIAASLRERERSTLRQAAIKHRVRKKWGAYNWISRENGFVSSLRSMDLLSGFKLWEEYMEASAYYQGNMPNRVLNIRYESFLNNPKLFLNELNVFCNLNSSETNIENISHGVIKSRGFAFEKDEELLKFYQKVKSTNVLKKYYPKCL